jgi:hypothetical protein
VLAEKAAKHLVLLPLVAPNSTSSHTAAAATSSAGDGSSGVNSSAAGRSSSHRDLNSSGSSSSVHDDEPMAALQAAARAFDEVRSTCTLYTHVYICTFACIVALLSSSSLYN